MHKAFGWSPVLPTDVKGFLIIILVSHPFWRAKALLWMHVSVAFFWVPWKDRNQRVFLDKEHPFEVFFDLVIYYAIS